MKKLFILLLMCIIGLGAKGQVSSAAFQKWHGDKYSMFIHFGLYSQLGGVWHQKQIQDGYSEQIRAFAQIPQAEYEKIAREFNPTEFNADSIALSVQNRHYPVQLLRCLPLQTGLRQRTVGSGPAARTAVRTILFTHRLALPVCFAHVTAQCRFHHGESP